MKRLICYFILCLMLPLSLDAQSYLKRLFTGMHSSGGLGINVGVVGRSQGFNEITPAISIFGWGVYLDCGLSQPAHQDDTRWDVWETSKSDLFHIGYQMPIAKWLMITPLVGYAYVEEGYTNGYSKRFTKDGGVKNDFCPLRRVSGFDYGCQVSFPIRVDNESLIDIVIMGTYTKFCWYGGVGIIVRAD